ncbi:adipocyte enhancer-binding protein 1-like [Salvia hispanica]|uniref:adipocyte enhancer-binding protein 1-like n=1 Tax=Salvia hispanica TaxID=49212 RepID=UPI0020092478|nr:adipocyte enhancer-binding protein 1-like [Salvia hispanica]
MATEKVTLMVLHADLQCPCCYKKIRKTLCKFPQIRDQVYDEKKNEVKITVVCCSPERIRDKLCCKGGKSIKSIKIIDLKPADKPKETPKEPEKPKEKPKEPEKPKEKPKEPEKPKEKPKEPEKPKAEKPKDNPEKPKDIPKGPEKPIADGGAPPPGKPEPIKLPESAVMPPAAMQMMGPGPGPALVHGVPSIFPYVRPSQDPYPAGPYYHGYGFPPPPQPIYDGYGYGYGYNQHGHHVNRDNYFSDENPQTCTIM